MQRSSQVKVSPPHKTPGLDAPKVETKKVDSKTPKVNLHAAQFSRFGGGMMGGNPFADAGPYESKIPDRFNEGPQKQIMRMDGDYNPYKEFYLDQLVSLYELPTRSKNVHLFPVDVNQNRFLASPLNFRGVMQSTTLFDVNLLRTGQIY
jgi:hypothetical protein